MGKRKPATVSGLLWRSLIHVDVYQNRYTNITTMTTINTPIKAKKSSKKPSPVLTSSLDKQGAQVIPSSATTPPQFSLHAKVAMTLQ